MLSCLLGCHHLRLYREKAQAALGILDRKDRLSSAKPQTVDNGFSTRLKMGLADRSVGRACGIGPLSLRQVPGTAELGKD